MTGGEIKMTIDEKIAKIDQREIAGVCSASVSTLPSRQMRHSFRQSFEHAMSSVSSAAA